MIVWLGSGTSAVDTGSTTDDAYSPGEEPSWAQTGIDTPGLKTGGHSDFILYGVYNGVFSLGAPEPSSDIDPVTASTSNFMPHWRFVQSSNTNISVKQANDPNSPSGSNFRFTFVSGAAGDEAFAEQLVDVGGSRVGAMPDHVRTYVLTPGANTGTFTAFLSLQYLTALGSIAGMPAEQTVSSTVAAGSTTALEKYATTAGITPANAKLLRIRFGVQRGGAANAAIGTVDFSEVRRQRTVSKQEFTTAGSYTWTKPADASWVQVVAIGGGGGGGSGRRGAAGSARCGGGSGAGGGMGSGLFRAADLPATVTVTVGSGGGGAAAVTSNDTDGATGSSGTSSTFGTLLAGVLGTGGQGGSTASSIPGGTASAALFPGGAGATGRSDATGGNGSNGSGGGPGGGGAGGVDSGNTTYNGGTGGYPVALFPNGTSPVGGVSGTSLAGAGTTTTGATFAGSGGGGGAGGGAGATFRNGGAGIQGSGGGGGGGVLNGANSGAGGNGGDGYVAVVAW